MCNIVKWSISGAQTWVILLTRGLLTLNPPCILEQRTSQHQVLASSTTPGSSVSSSGKLTAPAISRRTYISFVDARPFAVDFRGTWSALAVVQSAESRARPARSPRVYILGAEIKEGSVSGRLVIYVGGFRGAERAAVAGSLGVGNGGPLLSCKLAREHGCASDVVCPYFDGVVIFF